MSSIQAIMNELQSGEAAKQRVPELERTILELNRRIDGLERHNQGLELRAGERDALIESQSAEIHRLREERDDASFRELEAQDRLAQFEKAVGSAWGGLGNAINALHPPKAEPVKVEPSSPLSTGSPSPEPTGGQSTKSAPEPSASGQSERPPQEGFTAAIDASPKPTVSDTIDASVSGTAPTPDPWKPSVEMPEVKPEDGHMERMAKMELGKPAESAVYKPFSDPPKPNFDKPSDKDFPF